MIIPENGAKVLAAADVLDLVERIAAVERKAIAVEQAQARHHVEWSEQRAMLDGFREDLKRHGGYLVGLQDRVLEVHNLIKEVAGNVSALKVSVPMLARRNEEHARRKPKKGKRP